MTIPIRKVLCNLVLFPHIKLFMKISLAILLIFSAVLTRAQEDSDILYQKDGSIYQGKIVEYIPDSLAIIKLIDGRIINVDAESLRGLTIGNDVIIKKKIDIKTRGYFNNTLIGPQFGKSEYGNIQTYFAFNTVNGYKINGHHMGVGLGIENHSGNWYSPLYADYSYHFLKGNITPVLGVNGGFMIPLDLNNYGGAGRNDYQKGGFIGGRLGFAAYSGKHFAFMLNLTYRYIRLSDAKYSVWNPFGEPVTFNGTADLHRVGIMVGMVIN